MTTAPSRSRKTSSVKSQTYTALRTAVRQAIALGKDRAVQAVEREKVRTSWEIGKLILDHVLLNKDRADYGALVIVKLSKDLSMSKTELTYIVEFARAYPIVPPASQLSWSHYRELLSINQVETRKRLTNQTLKNNWTRDQLRSEVNKLKTVGKSPKKPETLKKIKPGTLDVFRTRVVNGKTFIDLGFSTYLLKSKVKQKLKMVQNRNFTYRAEVEAVVDGDSIWCLVDLGLGVNTRQKLRLAHINAPEVISKDGIVAKKFLSGKMTKGSSILIATTKSDKFDRYLVDVWLDAKTSEKTDLILSGTKGKGEEQIYINKLLVDEGVANVV